MIRPWAALYPPPRAPRDWDATHRIATDDGVTLALHRRRGRGSPVLLVHGLAANRTTFDFPGRSLAEHLAHHGFDAWVAELRGAGASDRPSAWDFDDHLRRDLPAIVRAVREATGAERLHWIGHSLGGIMLYAYAATAGAEALRSGVTIAAALDYSTGATAFRSLQSLLPLAGHLGLVPWGALTHWVSPLCGYVASPLETFNLCRANVEPEHNRRLHAEGFEAMPARLLASIAPLVTGAAGLAWREAVAGLAVPLCLIGGSDDRQCSMAMVEATARRLTRPPRVLAFGKEHGHRTDYGHFDLVMGRNAPGEVWPCLVAWLREHDR